MGNHLLTTIVNDCLKVCDKPHDIPMILLNIQSLPPHKRDGECDLSQASILLLKKTCGNRSEEKLENFTCITDTYAADTNDRFP